jgi:hypothetical protein
MKPTPTTTPAATFAQAEAVHRQRYRAMTPAQRLRLADELSLLGRKLLAAGRAARAKPDASPRPPN